MTQRISREGGAHTIQPASQPPAQDEECVRHIKQMVPPRVAAWCCSRSDGSNTTHHRDTHPAQKRSRAATAPTEAAQALEVDAGLRPHTESRRTHCASTQLAGEPTPWQLPVEPMPSKSPAVSSATASPATGLCATRPYGGKAWVMTVTYLSTHGRGKREIPDLLNKLWEHSRKLS